MNTEYVILDSISNAFGLSKGTVKKIAYNKKQRAELTFRPEVSSAEEYAECGLLEEWVHTYLLFERKNKEFSDELYLEDRYFIGPVKMPLTLFHQPCEKSTRNISVIFIRFFFK